MQSNSLIFLHYDLLLLRGFEAGHAIIVDSFVRGWLGSVSASGEVISNDHERSE